MEDLLPEFLTETLESLDTLDSALVRLESQPGDAATLGAIFRHVHTIKGTCGFLGLARLEHVAHAAESVLDRHRSGDVPVTTGSITVILRTLDTIRAIVDGIQATGQEPAGDDAALVAALEMVAHDRAPGPAEPDPAPSVPAACPADPPLAGPTHIEPAAVADAPEPAAQTIRVNVEVLERLMTLVSELVLTRNQILQLARTRQDEAFTGPLQRLSHITSDLQEGVMKTRMQPIGTAWSNLPRLVRDLSQELGKKIELVMQGAETELDRQVLELIKDPLTHMIRNSGDHGLETPAERQAAGKTEQGRIVLNAFHDGGHILIEVSDDGRGLAVERIRAKAIANGLATEGELTSLSDQQIRAFIFRAGFSTAAAITAVSGRGVGMDVVKTNIERIGGTIELSSVEGAGTTFTLKIPLTLAVVSVLIVEVCGERFAIPQVSVVELIRARAASVPGGGRQKAGDAMTDPVIETIEGTPVLRLRDSLLPLVDLAALMELRPAAPDAPASAKPLPSGSDSRYMVVVQAGSARFGLVVDHVFDTDEIVLKPVAPILRHISLFSGTTILGDGRVIMVLDPAGIARSSGLGAARARPRVAEPIMAGHETSVRPLALLFKSHGGRTRAVPLGLIARLESIGRDAIERSGTELVTQYHGKLIPLVPLSDHGLSGAPAHLVLVFADGERTIGLIVDEIVDMVEDRLRIELATDEPGFLGVAIIDGKATSILDTAYWLQRGLKDWFAGSPSAGRETASILVMEDSAFFRSLIVATLSAVGYQVTAVDSPMAALAMREAGRSFDLVLSDIEMPGMNGIAFIREIRMAGAWIALPVIALSSLSGEEAVARFRAAGFDDYIPKFDRALLLDTVAQALGRDRPGQGNKALLVEEIAS